MLERLNLFHFIFFHSILVFFAASLNTIGNHFVPIKKIQNSVLTKQNVNQVLARSVPLQRYTALNDTGSNQLQTLYTNSCGIQSPPLFDGGWLKNAWTV